MKKLIYLFLTLLIVACSTDDNNNIDDNNNVDDNQVEWLYVQTALEATATSSTTIVIPFTEDIFAFTDRPNREHKYISGDEFASYWNDYDDENSFKLDPPNAVLTWVDGGNVEEVEVVITDADFDGNNVIYTIESTTIVDNQIFEDVSLFVDGKRKKNNVYLASNGITVKASAGAVAGDTGVLNNGVTYTIVDLNTLNTMISDEQDVTKVVTSLVTDMSNMFVSCNASFCSTTDISTWDVSNVTDMYQMFENSSVNSNLSSWDVSSVTNMNSMFQLSGYNQDISTWDVSSVTDMDFMFYNSAFNQDIRDWDVSSVNTMQRMFNSSYFNQPIGDWDVSSVTDMYGMFGGANRVFNQPIGDWDVSNVTDMELMFSEASSFNQDLSSWNVSNVTECNCFSIGTSSWILPQPNFTNCDSTWCL